MACQSCVETPAAVDEGMPLDSTSFLNQSVNSPLLIGKSTNFGRSDTTMLKPQAWRWAGLWKVLFAGQSNAFLGLKWCLMEHGALHFYSWIKHRVLWLPCLSKDEELTLDPGEARWGKPGRLWRVLKRRFPAWAGAGFGAMRLSALSSLAPGCNHVGLGRRFLTASWVEEQSELRFKPHGLATLEQNAALPDSMEPCFLNAWGGTVDRAQPSGS